MPPPIAVNQNVTLVNGEQHIELISSDGVAFWVRRQAAIRSKLIQRAIDVSDNTVKINLSTIDSAALKIVVEYLNYSDVYQENPDEAPQFIIEPSSLDKVTRAADFLEL